MQEKIEAIQDLYKSWSGNEPASIDVLQQAGSERRYFRIWDKEGGSVIGTYGANVPENNSFYISPKTFLGRTYLLQIFTR
ncbi:hypothetical protein LWM68_01310 [Niabella sp. W65]|nr:hypothetical protein [Niabella sp. W65]MCH7361541.1 hypothetical protein [Niabella sp. W65]ULT45337.1 hypothetical protein KRR40_19880 [Niabella sp. I65]